MSPSSDDPLLRSGLVALSVQARDDGVPSELSAHRDARYEPGAVLGRGGMGEVRCVVDHHLGRTVARKVARRGDAAAEARLAREARITARLEHPGIVPVYDVGRDEDGRLYYTMRIIRGQTLASAIAAAHHPRDRVRLLRCFLDACTAVAYAHEAGVLHRDLSPSNILVGGFGEAQVADWGLAVELDEATGATSPAGTPAYMSPEQLRGRPVDRRSDVWTLGAVLHETITGAPPFGRVDRTERLARGDRVPALARPGSRPAVAPDLAAIVDRALSTEPRDRYPDAGALADDLARFIDGRAVAAYEYSPWESLLRLARAWRAPLLVAAVALLLLGGVGGVAWARNVSARQRAEAAEQRAEAARRRADHNLARTLVVRALELQRGGHRAQAEVLASHALELRESPEARGVLAAGFGLPRPELIDRRPIACRHATFDDQGDTEVCVTASGLEVDGVAWPTGPLPEGTRVTRLSAHTIAMVGPGPQLVVLDDEGRVHARVVGVHADARVQPLSPRSVIAVGGSRLGVVPPGATDLAYLEPCRSTVLGVTTARDGRTFVACSEGSVLALAPDAPALRPLASMPDDDGRIATMHHDAARDELVVGTLRGVVRVLDARSGATRARLRVDPQLVDDARLHPDDPWLIAVQLWRGETLVADLRDGRVLLRLPRAEVDQTRWREHGQVLRRLGAVVEDWELPRLRPLVPQGESGIATVASSRSGRSFVVGRGSGELSSHGEARWSRRWHADVIKDAAFSADDARLAAAAVSDYHIRILDARTGEELHRLETIPVNRILWLGDTIVGLAYSGGPRQWDARDLGAPSRALQPALRLVDAEPLDDARALGLDLDGTLWWIEPGRDPALTEWVARPGASAAAPRPGGGAAIAEGEEVVLLDAQGRVHARLRADAPLLEVAVSPDDRLVAAGAADGLAFVWDAQTGERRAVLAGHGDRLVTLAFTSARHLVSGGWDGRVLRWDLGVLGRDPTSMRAEAELRWGLDLERAMAG